MNNVAMLRSALPTPNMEKVLAAVSAYSVFWEKRTFAFLPLLHELIDRHYQGFIKYTGELEKNSEVLAVGIRSEDVGSLLKDLKASSGNSDDEEFLFEELQNSANNVGTKLNALLTGVVTALNAIASLPGYEVNRDRDNYLQTQEQLSNALPALNVQLEGKRTELTELERAIGVFESNGLDKLFEGNLPTVQQVQELVALGTTPAAAVVAVEKALEALNKLMAGIQDGMRYSKLQDRRRALRAQVNEIVAEQREKGSRLTQLQNHLKALEEYVLLNEKRQGWVDEKNIIRTQLESVRDQLRSIKIKNIDDAQMLDKLLVALRGYVNHVVVKIREAF